MDNQDVFMDAKTRRSKERYEGKPIFKTNDGEEVVEVTEFRSYADVTAHIVGTDHYSKHSMGSVKNGIPNPYANNSPIGFAEPKYKYLGSIYPTNEGYHIKVIGYEGTSKITYEFLDSEQPHIGTTTMQNIKNGEVKNPYRVNAFGGYIGTSDLYTRNASEFGWLYRIWNNMLIRGHEPNKAYYNKYRPDTTIYNDTMMDPVWLNFSNFADWYMTQYNSFNHPKGLEYVIDKDLLYRYYCHSTNGKKCYGPNTCVLIPKTLNNSLGAEDEILKSQLMDTSGKTHVIGEYHPVKKKAVELYNNGCLSKVALDAILDL